MSSIADANTSVEDIEKKSQSNEDDEDQKLGLYTVDTKRGDEALQLVGAERKEQFSEEYNLKLRRKLVRLSLWLLAPCLIEKMFRIYGFHQCVRRFTSHSSC